MKKPFFLLGYKDNHYTLTSATSIGLFVLGMIFGLLLVICWPFLCIWALNTIFGLTISYNIYTWLAAVIMIITITGNPLKVRKKTNE